MVLRTDELQLSRGESIRDTAYVLSRHAAAVGIRTGPDELVAEFAEHAGVPVFNMLTAGHHPCQALADLLTLREAFGDLEGLTLAYVGDGNNVARSLAIVGALAGVEVRVAAPDGYQLEPIAGRDPDRRSARGGRRRRRRLHRRLGQHERRPGRPRRSAARARSPTGSTTSCSTSPRRTRSRCTACPAHPGEEITASVLYGERQRIWDQAENRRHAQKALLELLLSELRHRARRRPKTQQFV